MANLTKICEWYAEAIEGIEHWASYANDYAQVRENLDGLLALHRNRLASIRPADIQPAKQYVDVPLPLEGLPC